MNYKELRPEIPVIKNVWLRLLAIFLIAFAVSYLVYSALSPIDLETIGPLVYRHDRIAFLMLSIMPAIGWGCFFFITIMGRMA